MANSATASKSKKTLSLGDKVKPAEDKGLSPFDLGDKMAAAGFNLLAIAAYVVALLGDSVYSPKDGLPKWGKLGGALKAAEHKVDRSEFALGMAARWDKVYILGALSPESTLLHARQVEYRALLKACGVKSAEQFTGLTPAAKGKLGEGNDAKAAKVQELTTLLNGFFSDSWGNMKKAEDRFQGRLKKGAPPERSLTEKLLRTSLESLPAAVAKAVEDGFEVHEDLKTIAALILKHRGWAKVKAEA